MNEGDNKSPAAVADLGQDLVAPAPGAQIPAMNYAQAFDPSSEMYSVNTGNANVRQLEDLRSMFSSLPAVIPQPPLAGGNPMFRFAMIAVALYWLLGD